MRQKIEFAIYDLPLKVHNVKKYKIEQTNENNYNYNIAIDAIDILGHLCEKNCTEPHPINEPKGYSFII